MPLPPNPLVAIVGATGAVGAEFLSLIDDGRLTDTRLRLLASPRSAGARLAVGGREVEVEPLDEHSFDGVDLALFSAGGSVSRAHAPAAVAAGCTVVDNSSAFRMDPDVPLIVPEINAAALEGFEGPGIIANPNCSTIIALMAVTPLHRAAGVDRMVVSTYQAASGAGRRLMEELEQQARDFAAGRPLTKDVSGRTYLFNLYSHDSPVGADGMNLEERKLLQETRKIWDDQGVRVAATCVRVPVLRAHCEAINLTFRRTLSEADAFALLAEATGVRIVDDRAANRFPEPIDASGRDEVLVGRIRADASQPPGKGLSLFVAGDQLRKGAALNAIQIAEWLMARDRRSAVSHR